MRVFYSFSCSIYQGWNQTIQYHRALPTNSTFTNLNQIEECIKQCELQHLNLDDEGVWGKAYLPVAKITNSPRVYERHIEFRHIHVRLISSNELLLDCGPLPDWLCEKQCIYTINNTDDNLCIWQCLIISERIRCNWARPAVNTMRDALNLAQEFCKQCNLRVNDARQ